jgi:hypothetical protein
MNAVSGPLRRLVIFLVISGLLMVLAGGIVCIYYRTNAEMRHKTGGPAVFAGFVLLGAGNMIIMIKNIRAKLKEKANVEE